MNVDNLLLWARSQTESGRKSSLDRARKANRDLCNSARGSVSKADAADVLHRAKVFPREMSPAQPNLSSFISKLNKTAGQRYIDTPGTVYLEVFVDRPQGHIVLSFSFAGAAVQKTKEPADT